MGTATPAVFRKMSPQLLVADISRSIEFYTTKLGFGTDFKYENFYAGISREGFSIHLKTGIPATEERKSKRINEDLDIVFNIEGIEIFYNELKSRSVEIIKPLQEMDYGKEFYATDPDGYILAFLE